MKKPTLTKITCPTCGTKHTWQLKNTFRPFCSERCKLIDLGEWANETRKIPGRSVSPLDDLDDLKD
ncbi:DNA gyrase inhibitor YacG [Legionella sp. D16C41]|uniref:DNA gyrase inhibitor YacG n=1 Tax=Legionella sp. D16C41 TaxID=3402688 RepID=UPI003AF7B63C